MDIGGSLPDRQSSEVQAVTLSRLRCTDKAGPAVHNSTVHATVNIIKPSLSSWSYGSYIKEQNTNCYSIGDLNCTLANSVIFRKAVFQGLH